MENHDNNWAPKNNQPVQSNDWKNKYIGDIKPIMIMVAINSTLFILLWVNTCRFFFKKPYTAIGAPIAQQIVDINERILNISFSLIVVISFISLALYLYITAKIKSPCKHNNTLGMNQLDK